MNDYTPNDHTCPAEAYLNKEATCERLNVSARCLESMIAKKRFPPGVRLGKEKFWSHAAINEFLVREFNRQAAFWRSRPT
ncbi:helix-turn-helix domain-containing protein [Paucibacter sp. B2R-40]|uniref:helix-turn-helix transcriptional regulator n=1 Tax=Paucibacter sp. B2R-40 TaxID=2893554 RepID=UPI0021E44A96|nr:helix-turn-helix domain-containing protein [Paucibacter sp. B2R-40]MCV2352635.1 helix-turn-helix domain-containing protein [Paucibacter sp. B2R-40]